MAKSSNSSRTTVRSARTGKFVDGGGRSGIVKTEHFAGAITRVRQMTLNQKVQSLIDSGILTKSGKRLAKPYRADEE